MEQSSGVWIKGSDSSWNRKELAKQKASIRWLLSKAYNNEVPEIGQEPFYVDNMNQEHLKPAVVYSLASGELYCLALTNIYADPNYSNLNHTGILQTLIRKGVVLPDPQITETILIQTTPLKLSAHMTVIEGVMMMYLKEVASLGKVSAAIQKVRNASLEVSLGIDNEQALFLWVDEVISALSKKVVVSPENTAFPVLEKTKQWTDLCDGIRLGLVVSFYHPEYFDWKKLSVNSAENIMDKVSNLKLVVDFCQAHLPYNIFHMTLEDIAVVNTSMRINVIILLADVFYALDNKLANQVKRTEVTGQVHANQVKRTAQVQNPSLSKQNLNESGPSSVPMREKEVPKSRAVSNLISCSHANNTNVAPAGRRSGWEGYQIERRSRRNSISEESQLTIENFGGSQGNLHLLGRNPDKQPAVHVANKEQDLEKLNRLQSIVQNNWSSTSVNNALQSNDFLASNDSGRNASWLSNSSPVKISQSNDFNTFKRSERIVPVITHTWTQNTARSSQNGGLHSTSIRNSGPETSVPNKNTRNISNTHDTSSKIGTFEDESPVSFSKNGNTKTGTQTWSDSPVKQQTRALAQMFEQDATFSTREVKFFDNRAPNEKSTSAVQSLTNITTWQQLKSYYAPNVEEEEEEVSADVEERDAGVYIQQSPRISDIRLKLEEKRRQIESEKRRIEATLSKRREKLGKAAFLHAVVKDTFVDNIKNGYPSDDQSPPSSDSIENSQFQRYDVNVPEKPVPFRLVPPDSPSKYSMHSPKESSFVLPPVTSPPHVPFTLRSTGNVAPVPSPSADDMAPQCISFIGSEGEQEGLCRMQISSGTRTYRIPSPTKPVHVPVSNSFAQNTSVEKGFYVSFDNDTAPKKPKPPLRLKKISRKDQKITRSSSDTSFGRNEVSQLPVSSPASSTSSSKQSEGSGVPKVYSSSDTSPSVRCVMVGDEYVGDNSRLVTDDEMERKKERILMLSLQRRQQQEELKIRKEIEAQRRKEREKEKQEAKEKKKELEKQRRAAILEQHRIKKAIEEAEREGKPVDKELLKHLKPETSTLKLRTKPTLKPRPKTIHVGGSSGSVNSTDTLDEVIMPPRSKRNSASNAPPPTGRRDYYRGSQDCLVAETGRAPSVYSDVGADSCSTSPSHSIGRHEIGRDASLDRNTHRVLKPRSRFENRPHRANSLMNLCGDQDSFFYRYGDADSGLGRTTPPQRVLSPSQCTSPTGPGSLPIRKRYDDTASESGGSEYSGPRLYKQPATKSNRGIILNAVEYCVFPGVVNLKGKQRVLEEIAASDAKHFMILFRDSGLQFRALYSYTPETEEVIKLYGTGPKQITENMFDKFFKYNSGGKRFSQVHTKHLTVTIDAFTIHNSLWQGRKTNLPSKKEMTLVI